MVKITIIKNEMTDREKQITILITERTYDALINALYPARNRDAKGFVELVNFLYQENR